MLMNQEKTKSPEKLPENIALREIIIRRTLLTQPIGEFIVHMQRDIEIDVELIQKAVELSNKENADRKTIYIS